MDKSDATKWKDCVVCGERMRRSAKQPACNHCYKTRYEQWTKACYTQAPRNDGDYCERLMQMRDVCETKGLNWRGEMIAMIDRWMEANR